MNRFRRWATERLELLREELGYRCARCSRCHQLEFDCIIPQGDKHHRFETNRRAVFYYRQHKQGNLQLLCCDCHKRKTRNEAAIARGRQAELEMNGCYVEDLPF